MFKRKDGKAFSNRFMWKTILMVSLIVFFGLVIYSIIAKPDMVGDLLGSFTSIISPIVWGLVFAYLFNPVVMFFERVLGDMFPAIVKLPKQKKKIRLIGIILTLVVVLFALYILADMIIPELYQSVLKLTDSMPSLIDQASTWLEELQLPQNNMSANINSLIKSATDSIQDWLTTGLLPELNTAVTYFTSGVIGVVRGFVNAVIGFIVSVYLLYDKEMFISQSKKVIYAVNKQDRANVIIKTLRKSNEIFGGFISGKIIDSIIIGILCFIGLSILRMPYTLLVSVIVGVTNVIPVFGPYIGAIPSALLILITSPIKGLYFIIFIIILQQLDGNFIGPKILGDSTGLSNPFWVVFAIVIGSGMFGLVGMLIGVPLFAVVYYIAREILNYQLKKRGLSTDSKDYELVKSISEEGEIEYLTEEDRERKSVSFKDTFGTLFKKDKKAEEEPVQDDTANEEIPKGKKVKNKEKK